MMDDDDGHPTYAAKKGKTGARSSHGGRERERERES